MNLELDTRERMSIMIDPRIGLEVEGADVWNEWLEPVSDEEYDALA